MFLEERRRLLAGLAARRLGDLADDAGRGLLAELASAESPISSAVPPVVPSLLARAAADELTALATTEGPVGPRMDRIRGLLGNAGSMGIVLELRPEVVAPLIEAALGRVLAGLRAGVTAAAVSDALALLALAASLDVTPALWSAQNEAVRLWRAGTPPTHEALAPLMAALGFAETAFPAPRREAHRE